MNRFVAATACLALLVPFSSRAQEATRPPPHATSPLAVPIETSAPGPESAGARYIKSLAPDVQKKLQAENQVLLGEEKADSATYGGYIRAVAIFHLPKKRVFDLMCDTATQALYLPHLVSANVDSKPANGELTRFALKFLWSNVKFRVQHWFYPEQSRSEWHLDTSVPHDIKAQEGYWQLFEMGPDVTVGEYGTRVETGMAVPKFISDMFARGDIPKALTAFRKYMDSDGKYRRED
jgi:hypothetical protein